MNFSTKENEDKTKDISAIYFDSNIFRSCRAVISRLKLSVLPCQQGEYAEWKKGYSIPYDIILSNNMWWNEEGRRHTWTNGIFLFKKPLHVMCPAFQEMAEHLPADRK